MVDPTDATWPKTHSKNFNSEQECKNTNLFPGVQDYFTTVTKGVQIAAFLWPFCKIASVCNCLLTSVDELSSALESKTLFLLLFLLLVCFVFCHDFLQGINIYKMNLPDRERLMIASGGTKQYYNKTGQG